MINIRYHHLMCIPRYKGEGYSQEFCENLKYIKSQIKENNYQLVDYCDDVCKACPNNKNGKCEYEQKVSRYDKLVKSAIEKGITPLPKDICYDCSWYYICKTL